MSKSPAQNDWYHDACGTAHALELVGERWALLIVRELMWGPRRFGEIRAGLPGISANVLTQRLDGLEKTGVLTRRALPSPANAQVYELTAWGYELEPVFRVTGKWAARSPGHDPSLPISVASFLLSLRTMFSAEQAAGLHARIGLCFAGDTFVARIAPREITIARGEVDEADAVLTMEPATLAAVIYGGRSITDAERAGQLSLVGDRALAKRFTKLFVLPPKVSAPAA